MAKASSSLAAPRTSLNYDPKAGELAEGYCRLDLVRRGRFTEILEVVESASKSPQYLIKLYKRDDTEDGAYWEVFYEMESHCLKSIDHPLIASLVCTKEVDSDLGVVCKYHRRGDFQTIQETLPGRRFNADAVRFYAGELLLALDYLHRRLIYHRGIQPKHLLMKSNGHLVLTDFGQALALGCEVPRAAPFVCVGHYMSPELLESIIFSKEDEAEKIEESEKKAKKSGQSQRHRRFGYSMVRLFSSCVRTINLTSRRIESPTDNERSSSPQKSKFSAASSSRRSSETVPTETCVAETALCNSSETSPSEDVSICTEVPISDALATVSFMMDFYAYGCTIFYLLTGEKPFSLLEPMSRQLFDQLVDVDALMEEVEMVENTDAADFIYSFWTPTLCQRFGYQRNVKNIKRHDFLKPLKLEDYPNLWNQPPPEFLDVGGTRQTITIESEMERDGDSQSSSRSLEYQVFLRDVDTSAKEKGRGGKLFNESMLTKGKLVEHILNVLPTASRTDRLQFRVREQCEEYQADLKVTLAPGKLVLDREIVCERGSQSEKELLLMEGGTIIMRDAKSGADEQFLIDENDDLQECWVEGGVVSKIILHTVKGDFEFYGAKGMDVRVKNMFKIYGGVNPMKWPIHA